MVTGVMDAVKGAKELAEIIKKYNDLPLYEKIVELQGQIVNHANQIVELSAENASLKAELRKRTEISFRNPYFFEADSEIPMCPKCYSSSRETLKSYLTHPPKDFVGGHGRVCRICNEFYREGPRQVPAKTINVSRAPWRDGWMS